MKNLKRLLTLLLAFCMALSLMTVASAVWEDAVRPNTRAEWVRTYYCPTCGSQCVLASENTDPNTTNHLRIWHCVNPSCGDYAASTGHSKWFYTVNARHVWDETGTCTVCSAYNPSLASCSHGSYSYSYQPYNSSYHSYVQTCRLCGETISSSLQSHRTSYTCTPNNSSTHSYAYVCTQCGDTTSSGTASHTWSTSYSQYSSSQHRVSRTCTGCGYNTSSYASHADGNGDGKCDSCSYSMSVTVTWDAATNGGTVNGSGSVTTSVTSGSTATVPGYTPVKAGHRFQGWYTSASGGSLYNTVTVTNPRTFYAQFTANQYTITWDLGDGQTQTTSQTYGQALALPATPSKTGHTFQGWYTSETGGTQVTASTTYTTAGPTTYYARWEASDYTITWDLGGGQTQTTSQTYGQALTLPATPSKTGHTFIGWYTAQTGGTQVTASTTYTIAGPTTYYARWEASDYTITWDLGGGQTQTTSQTYGQALTLPATPSKTGHTFQGWYTAQTGGTQVTASTTYTTAGPTTYYARWEASDYTITWDLGDGQTETTQQTYGEKLVLPTQPLKDGYTFLGWFTSETGGDQVTGDTIYTATSPTTYYARWELIPVFSVTVPVTLALTVSEQGQVYAASNAEVVNWSTAAVEVTGITVSAVNGWTLVPYDTDMASEKVDSMLIGFALNGAETTTEGSSEALALTGDWTVPLDGTLPLAYDAVVSALSEPVDQQVVSILFVLEWA